jgi:hypothetical protein
MKQIDESLGGCNRTSWAPASPAELVKGTHKWSDWLNKASSESIADEACTATAGKHTMPALRRIENFVMLKKPDADRPHQFTFRRQQLSDGSTMVVMDYKHWGFETEKWNTESHVGIPLPPKWRFLPASRLWRGRASVTRRNQYAS